MHKSEKQAQAQRTAPPIDTANGYTIDWNRKEFHRRGPNNEVLVEPAPSTETNR